MAEASGEGEPFRNALVDIGSELAEPAFDRLVNSELLKDLPVVGVTIGLARLSGAIRDKLFALKVDRFLANLGNAAAGDIAAMRFELKRDPELAQRTGRCLAITLDRLDEIEKAEITAKLFLAFLRKRLNLYQLRRLCRVVDQGFLDDLQLFAGLESPEDIVPGDFRGALIQIGLAETSTVTRARFDGNGAISVEVTSVGRLYWCAMNNRWHAAP